MDQHSRAGPRSLRTQDAGDEDLSSMVCALRPLSNPQLSQNKQVKFNLLKRTLFFGFRHVNKHPAGEGQSIQVLCFHSNTSLQLRARLWALPADRHETCAHGHRGA